MFGQSTHVWKTCLHVVMCFFIAPNASRTFCHSNSFMYIRHPVKDYNIKSIIQAICSAVFSLSCRSHAWFGSDVLLDPCGKCCKALQNPVLFAHCDDPFATSGRWGREGRRMSWLGQRLQNSREREAGTSARELRKRHGRERKNLWQVGQRKE